MSKVMTIREANKFLLSNIEHIIMITELNYEVKSMIRTLTSLSVTYMHPSDGDKVVKTYPVG